MKVGETIMRLGICILLAIPVAAPAQPSEPPKAYSLKEVNALLGPRLTREVYRDGTKVLVDQTSQPSSPGSQESHIRTLYDLTARVGYTWNVPESGQSCGRITFDRDSDWGDPFTASRENRAGIEQQHAKQLGPETVNGIAASVMEAATPDIRGKIWLDPKTGLMVRMDVAFGSAPYETKYELKSFQAARPPASLFRLPAACGEAAEQPLPKTDAQAIQAETGAGQDYANAVMPPLEPMPLQSCNVFLRVVREGTLQPVRSAFQVALDTTSGQNQPPKVEMGLGLDGRAHFEGIAEVTARLRDGVLRIPNAPENFWVYLNVIHGSGGGLALIHRQCYRLDQVLLFIMAPEQTEERPDRVQWLWVKGGRLAAPLAAGTAQ
jgi:hypothetical protein